MAWVDDEEALAGGEQGPADVRPGELAKQRKATAEAGPVEEEAHRLEGGECQGRLPEERERQLKTRLGAYSELQELARSEASPQ